MNKTQILLFSKNQNDSKEIEDKIFPPDEMTITVVSGCEEAIEKFHQLDPEVVVLANDIDESESNKLNRIFKHQNADVIIVEQKNNSSDWVAGEIRNALDKQLKNRKPSFSFVDDALKNAGLPISIQ